MNTTRVAAVLRTHTVVTGLAGLMLFLLPVVTSTTWPWPLPPLSARFMGALLLGGAACSEVCRRLSSVRALPVMRFVAIGDVLIAAAGLLAIEQVGFTREMALFLVFFIGLALLLVVGLGRDMQVGRTESSRSVPRLVTGFFVVHLLVVLPVGCAMYFAPEWAQPLWPWKMAPLNVRLIGAFFLGASFISLWAARQRTAIGLLPVLALYAVFATLTTIASVIHIRLFDPLRRATWAFFALYVLVAGGSWVIGGWLAKDWPGRRSESEPSR